MTGKRAIKEQLDLIIFGTDTRLGRLFDIILLWVILASVLTVLIESVKTLHLPNRLLFDILEWVFTILFTLEYLVRIWVSRRRWRYIFSFWGIIDFLSICPTYITLLFTGFHYLIAVRLLRLMRVFRILKLTRYTQAAEILFMALRASKQKIIVFLTFVSITVVIMGTLMYVVEGENNGYKSIPESIYWAIVTITTVGYGDITPKTLLGKFFSSLSMIIGYAIIAIPTGIVSVEISRASKQEKARHKCPQCHETIELDDRYCRHCGKKLEAH